MNFLHFPVMLLLSSTTTVALSFNDLESNVQNPNIPERFCSRFYVADFQALSEMQLLELANAAQNHGDKETEVSLLLNSYCRYANVSPPSKDRLILASRVIEAALDAENIEIATLTHDRQAEFADQALGTNIKAELLFDMSRARLLAFQDQLQVALELRRSIQNKIDNAFGENSEEAFSNKIRLRSLEVELGQLDQALPALLAIRADMARGSSFSWRSKLLLTHAISSALGLAGREREAVETLYSARLKLIEEFSDADPRVIEIDESIAELLSRMDRTDESTEIFSRVYLWQEKNLPASSFTKLRTLWHLGVAYAENDRVKSALEILKYIQSRLANQSSDFFRQFQFQILSLKAILDAERGNYLLAREEWQKVYLGRLAEYGPDATDTQVEATNLAIVMRRTGDDRKGCQLLTDVTDSIARNRPGDVWALEFAKIASYDCGLVGASNEKTQESLEMLQRSWGIISGHFDTTNLDALSALGTYASACIRIGHIVLAKKLLMQFVASTEAARASFDQGSEAQINGFSRWISSSLNSASPISSYRQLALLHAQDAELESALRVSELVRDRTLGDLFAEREWERTWLPAGDRARLDAVLDRIQDFDERLAEASDVVDRVRLEAERTLAVAERGRLVREMRSRLHIPEPSATPPNLDDLRARLAADTALVSLLHSGETWWALVITRDAPARFVPFSDPGLGNAATAWSRRLRGDPVRAWPVAAGGLELSDVRPPGAVGPFLSTGQLAQRLAESLLGPLQSAFAGMQRIVVVADDELVGVPLQALPLGGGLALDRFEFSYAPSLATYLRGQGADRRARYTHALLAIGAVESAPFDAPDTDDPIVIGIRYASDHPLEYAREEIDDIASLFPSGQATTWTGAKADKSTLRQASRSGALLQYRYVHFATHAWAHADRPESSAIALAGSAADLPAQRALTAAELAGLHMDSDLVVLSACETGAGRFEHGRGLLGLAYAGLAAGNRAELVSLWPIADDTTARFMQELYGRLRAGVGPVRALARTQRAFAHSSDPRLSDPIAWAPFVLYGGY